MLISKVCHNLAKVSLQLSNTWRIAWASKKWIKVSLSLISLFKIPLNYNRSLENMVKLSQSIDWNRINTILLSHYTVGTASEGADAYPPLLLYKCLLLQKCFHPSTIFRTYGINIDSDPELENQIYQVK